MLRGSVRWRKKDGEARSQGQARHPGDEVRPLLIGQSRIPASPSLVPFFGELALGAPAQTLDDALGTAVPEKTDRPGNQH